MRQEILEIPGIRQNLRIGILRIITLDRRRDLGVGCWGAVLILGVSKLIGRASLDPKVPFGSLVV